MSDITIVARPVQVTVTPAPAPQVIRTGPLHVVVQPVAPVQVQVTPQTPTAIVVSGGLGPAGPPGPPGPAGPTGTSYQATFSPATQWTVLHNLGYFPSVTTFDTLGRQIEGQVQHVDVTTAIVTFNVAVGGTVYAS